MANYTKVFTKPYADGYEDLPSQNTPITAETLNDKDDTLEHIEDYLYDNPIAEVVDNLTSNDASKALSAKQGKILNDTKLNVNDLPNSEVQTSDDGQFTTVTGGLMQKCEVELEPIQSGSGTPSPSNVRAISGHTQVQVGNVGKNKFNYEEISLPYTYYGITVNKNDGILTLNGTVTESEFIFPWAIGVNPSQVFYKDLKPSTEYTFTVGYADNNIGLQVFYRETETSSWIYLANSFGTGTLSFTTPSEYAVIWVRFRFASGIVLNNVKIYPMIRLASDTNTTFEPYNGYTTTINLGGTYYGGTLDAVSGKFISTHAIVDMGSLSWFLAATNRFDSSTLSNNIKKPTSTSIVANIICENYATLSIDNLTDKSIGVFTNGNLIVKDSAYSDATTFKTAMSGVKLCYELATPTTIQLDPQTLETLVGQNDVFAPLDGQSVEEVEFREVLAFEDVEKCISEKTELEITYSGFEGPILIQKNRSICNVYFSQIAFSNDTSATKDLFFNNVFPEGYEPSMNIAIPVLVFNRNTNSFDTLRIAIYGKDMGNMRGAIVIFNVPANSSYYLQTFFTYITG